MPRLLSQVLKHLGFPEEPRIKRRMRCTQVLSMERSLTMPISFVLQQQDQEEVSEHVHVSSRELAVVMDAVCALATTQA